MTANGIDPEVGALLDEVIRDPNSLLLRAPKTPLSELWSLREPKISDSAPFLSKVERHLLQRKREEVADLLLEASQVALEDPRMFWEQEPVPSKWGSRLRRAEVESLGKERALIVSVANGSGMASVASGLASASLRINPTDRTRIQYALGLNQEGHPGAALCVLEDVLSHCPGMRDLNAARTNYALVTAGMGRLEEGREWYGKAACGAEARPYAILAWLVYAMRSGHVAEALEASDVLSDACSPHHKEVDRMVELMAADMREGYWNPAKNSRDAVMTTRERGCAAARRVADVLA